MKKIVIIPSYEPDDKMVNTVKELIEFGFEDIIVVNDGSRPECDKYFKQVENMPQVTLINHKVNKGKGRAMKTGFEYILANRKDCDGVITVDADGQHKPCDIKKCLTALEENPDKIVLGVRDFTDPKVPVRSKFGNNLTRMVFKLCGMNISDTQTGLRAFPIQYVKQMAEVPGERYEYETRQLLDIHRLKIDIMEVVIETVYIDDNESSHFNPVKDSIKIYKVIFKYMGQQGATGIVGIKYALSSLSSFLVDIILFTIINLALNSVGVVSGVRILAATIGARVVSSLYNFIVNRRVVFDSKESGAKSMIKYYALAICQAAASYGGVYLLTQIVFGTNAGFVETLIKVLVDTCLFFISFFIQRNWVFKQKK